MPKDARRYLSKAAACAVAVLVGSLAVHPAVATADPPPAPAAPPGTVRVDTGVQPPDRFIVKFDQHAGASSGERAEAFRQVVSSVGISMKEIRQTFDGAAVLQAAGNLSEADAGRVVAALESRPDVEYAEPDQFLHPAATVNDPYFPQQWGLFGAAGMRVPAAWDLSTGAGVRVAVVDTGITAHSDLAPNLLPGYDMIADTALSGDGDGRDADPSDPGDWCAELDTPSSWHGTHVAGTIAAAANNGRGVAGIAHNAKIQPIRALGQCGGWTSDIAAALVWAAGGGVPGLPVNRTPARVINLSLGGNEPCSATMQGAVNYAVNAGNAVVVAAAGNENAPVARSTPANCQNVVTVGATGTQGGRAPYSNYGPGVDISAPGGDPSPTGSGIISTWNSGTARPAAESYTYMLGTSMAAPHVSGAAALMISLNPRLTPAQVEQTLKRTARPFPGGCGTGGCGTGLVDAAAAVGASRPR